MVVQQIPPDGDLRSVAPYKSLIPSGADLLFVLVAPIKAIHGAVKLAQSDGDLAAHVTVGQTILADGRFPAHSLASYTVPAEPFVAHAWLSEVLFAALYRLGGLPLLAVFTGIIIGLTHALVIVFLRRRGVDPRWAILAGLISLALSASHWLTRPHMFSILASALTIFLLESRSRQRHWYFAALFLVWANLHGGWIYGLVLIGAYVTCDLIALARTRDTNTRSNLRRNVIALAAAAAATLINPYGPGLHIEVIGAVTSPLLLANIAEYQSPNFHDAANVAFLLVLLLSVVLLSLTTARMPLPWLLVIVISLFFALRSFRNISLFGVTAWPLLALHVARSWPNEWRRFPYFADFARIDAGTRGGRWSVAVAALLLALGLNHGRVAGVQLISDRFDRSIFPVVAVERAQQAGLAGRTFTPWVWGGYLMYAWPGQPLHVDPLKFSETTITSYSRIHDLEPGWQGELDRWHIDLAILRRDARLATALGEATGWREWYRDSTAVVFTRAPQSSEQRGSSENRAELTGLR